MASGPVEIVVIGFHNGHFEGKIIAEMKKLIDAGTVRLLDATFVKVDADGEADVFEVAEIDDIAELTDLIVDDAPRLLTDEDIDSFLSVMVPGDAAAIICFEHSWLRPFRAAIESAGGEVLESVRIPGPIVDDVLALASEMEG